MDNLSVFLGKLSKVRVTSLIYRLENGAGEQAGPLTASHSPMTNDWICIVGYFNLQPEVPVGRWAVSPVFLVS